TIFSTVVVRTGISDSRPIKTAATATLSHLPGALRSGCFVSPIQGAFAPNVDVPGKQQGHEDHHLDEPAPAEIAERHGPRVEERDFDVEEKKDHRDEIELHRLPLAGGAHGRHAA